MSYETVVIGAGPGGKGVARRLARAGRTVAMVEQELVGGECPFWACIPSKTLLRPVEAAAEAAHVPGVAVPDLRWAEVAEYRDYMNSGLDDTAKAKSMTDAGVEVVRGHARIAGPGRVDVDGRVLETENIVIATGTTSRIPPIDGIESVDYWTNREATTLHEVPDSTLVIGGGPVGVELGQLLSRYGSTVTLVESAPRLLVREDESVGQRLAELMREEGIELRLGAQAQRVAPDGAGVEMELDSGERLRADRLIVAAGRAPRLDGIGLDDVGIRPGRLGIEVDEHCVAAENVYAVGDVTGVAPLTHVAAYQAGVASAHILGKARPADYRAIPRVVFCDPEVATVGITPEQAREQGIRTVASTVDLSDVDRTETYGRGLSGHLGVLADADRQVLVGAWAIGPLASEWIHTLVLAIKAEVPLAVLRDTVMQFPTFSEAVSTAVARLPRG